MAILVCMPDHCQQFKLLGRQFGVSSSCLYAPPNVNLDEIYHVPGVMHCLNWMNSSTIELAVGQLPLHCNFLGNSVAKYVARYEGISSTVQQGHFCSSAERFRELVSRFDHCFVIPIIFLTRIFSAVDDFEPSYKVAEPQVAQVKVKTFWPLFRLTSLINQLAYGYYTVSTAFRARFRLYGMIAWLFISALSLITGGVAGTSEFKNHARCN